MRRENVNDIVCAGDYGLYSVDFVLEESVGFQLHVFHILSALPHLLIIASQAIGLIMIHEVMYFRKLIGISIVYFDSLL